MALGWGKSCKIVGGYLLLAILSFLALSYFNPSKCPPANLFANLHYQIFASKVLERTLPHSTVHCYPLPGNAEVCRYTSLCIDRHSSIVLLNDHILKNIPFDDLSSPPHNNNKVESGFPYLGQARRKDTMCPHGGQPGRVCRSGGRRYGHRSCSGGSPN